MKSIRHIPKLTTKRNSEKTHYISKSEFIKWITKENSVNTNKFHMRDFNLTLYLFLIQYSNFTIVDSTE